MEVIKRTSTAEAIVEYLLERIQCGDLGPGDRLPSERQLQAELGVGRLSLREALARLSALGIIRVDHGRGAFVRERIDSEAVGKALLPLFPERDAKKLHDLVSARSLIEGELAALAASRRSDGDVAALEAILSNPGEALEDDEALADLDYSFHREIARIADNEFLTAMLEALASHIRSFLLHYAAAHTDHQEAIDRHLPILEAIRDRDPERARHSIRTHIDACRSSLEAYVKFRLNQQGE